MDRLVKTDVHPSSSSGTSDDVMHVGIANPRWRGKRSRHSRRMRNTQSYLSGERPIYKYPNIITALLHPHWLGHHFTRRCTCTWRCYSICRNSAKYTVTHTCVCYGVSTILSDFESLVVTCSPGLISFPAWISNPMPSKMWDEITYPFPNFNGATVEVCGWLSNVIPHFIADVIIYPCWD